MASYAGCLDELNSSCLLAHIPLIALKSMEQGRAIRLFRKLAGDVRRSISALSPKTPWRRRFAEIFFTDLPDEDERPRSSASTSAGTGHGVREGELRQHEAARPHRPGAEQGASRPRPQAGGPSRDEPTAGRRRSFSPRRLTGILFSRVTASGWSVPPTGGAGPRDDQCGDYRPRGTDQRVDEVDHRTRPIFSRTAVVVAASHRPSPRRWLLPLR
jgi:hypothetical protein